MNNNSGVNTILIVILLLVVVVLGAWWFAARGNKASNTDSNDAGLNVNVDLPGGSGGDGSGATEGGSAQ